MSARCTDTEAPRPAEGANTFRKLAPPLHPKQGLQLCKVDRIGLGRLSRQCVIILKDARELDRTIRSSTGTA